MQATLRELHPRLQRALRRDGAPDLPLHGRRGRALPARHRHRQGAPDLRRRRSASWCTACARTSASSCALSDGKQRDARRAGRRSCSATHRARSWRAASPISPSRIRRSKRSCASCSPATRATPRERASSAARCWRAYPTLLRVGLAEAVAYRAEFLVWMLTTTMPLVMLALCRRWRARRPSAASIGRRFVAYYLATLIVRQLTGAWVVWEMNEEIREGHAGDAPAAADPSVRRLHAPTAWRRMPMRALVALPIAVVVLVVVGGEHITHDPVIVAVFVVVARSARGCSTSAVSAIIGTLGALSRELDLQSGRSGSAASCCCSGYLVPLELFPHWLERIGARAAVRLSAGVSRRDADRPARSRADALRGLGVQWAGPRWRCAACCSFCGGARLKRFAAYGG